MGVSGKSLSLPLPWMCPPLVMKLSVEVPMAGIRLRFGTISPSAIGCSQQTSLGPAQHR
jgi:hypothetical protein